MLPHGRDFDHVLSMNEFRDVAMSDGQVKPIVLAFIDGGPDKNPHFPKTLKVAIEHFRKYNLDVYIQATHAPGMSAYNYVERRMAPLRRALSGVLLPNDTYDTYLDSQGWKLM